jgi:hypothetical protein
MHAAKGKESIYVHDPYHSMSQNAYIAPSNIVGAGLGVHSDTVYRKDDRITVYVIQP